MRSTLLYAVVILMLTASGATIFLGRSPAGAHAYTNRLVNEKSPYLQQHAHNPVDWYPWGAEAFEKARREDKPIFLSVGYSTCHWCHVMEAESFSNPEIAAYMNEHFVSIKVDREERPDLDRVYQNYVIGVSEGGWPMSVFLTPDLKPFFGANYLPPADRGRDPGFLTIMRDLSAMWTTNRAAALQAAAEGTQAMAARSSATTDATTGGSTDVDPAQVIDAAYQGLAATFDATNGGFGGAPKFPRPVVLNFLFRHYATTKDPAALDMAVVTLRGMARGGIHDQLGGGFHRYATDREWRVPHYEKMLYDQAQLAVSYTEAFQATRDPVFRAVARDTIDYVLRDLRSPGGAFYSAEDADSKPAADAAHAEEGAFYLWDRAGLERVVGADAEIVAARYDVGPVPGALSARQSVADIAARFQRTAPEIRVLLDRANKQLLAARTSRPHPPLDDKVLVAWNGLMMSALARAAQAFDDSRYRAAAEAQARFIEQRMFSAADGTLKRRYRHGEADIDALLEDYAFLVQGLLDLYETSFDVRWLTWATRLQETQDRLFWDAAAGGYFSTRADAADLLTRAKEEYDGAEPAANSVAVMNLLRLWRVTAQARWRERADATVAVLSPRLARSGGALPQLLAAIDFSRAKSKEIVIAGDPNGADTQALLRLIHGRFMPSKVIVVSSGGRDQATLTKLVPFIDGMERRDGRATIYVCENYACRLPTTDPAVAARLLSE